MKQDPRYTKGGNWLLRSTRSKDLIEFAVLIDAKRVWNGNIHKKNKTWVANAYWANKEFLNRGLAEYDTPAQTTVRLTKLGKEMLQGALAKVASGDHQSFVKAVIEKIETKRVII